MANAPPLPPRLVNRKAVIPKSQYDREFIATHRPQVGVIPPPLPPRRPANGDPLIREDNVPHDILLLEEDVRPPLPPRVPSHDPIVQQDHAKPSSLSLDDIAPPNPRSVPINTDENIPLYTYSPLNSDKSEIRLLSLPADVKQFLRRTNVGPLVGSMKNYYLPHYTLPRSERLLRSARIPPFYALSYVWGDATRTREIIIDKQRLKITENLHRALSDLQGSSKVTVRVWVDAICINQDDVAERSAQILLMREIYHSAGVATTIWLGPSTEQGRQCLKFITDLAGGLTGRGSTDLDVPEYSEDDVVEERLMKAMMIPSAALSRGLIGARQTVKGLGDIIEPTARDGMAEMLLDPDGNLSLHEDTIDKLVAWKPSSRHWKKVQNEDFVEMANLLDKTFIQDCAWFERMWVVQELCVADRALIIFSGSALPWTNFLRAFFYLHYSLDAPITNIRKLVGLEKIRQAWIQGKRQPLRDLIHVTRYRRATDPRDKLFSLVGLMGDDMQPFLKPDYSKSVSEVYSNVAFHFIVQSESLDPLCGWQTLGRQEQLPFWVPDYNLNQDLVASPLVAIDGRKSIYSASGQDTLSKYTGLDIDKISDSWSQLRAPGLLIDSIEMLSDASPEDDQFGLAEQMWHSTICNAPGMTKEIESSLENISSIVGKYSDYWNSMDRPAKYSRSTDRLSKLSNSTDRFLRFSKSTDRLSKTSMSTDNLSRASTLSEMDQDFLHFDPIVPDPLIHHNYILGAFVYSLLCGRISRRERLTAKDINSILSLHLPRDASDPNREEFLTKACLAFEAGMTRRSIALTKRGYIGAAPQESQSGDLVCVLFGCSVPVVLRKRIGGEYQFVGECYMHGFMDGEALEMQATGQVEAHDFVLG